MIKSIGVEIEGGYNDLPKNFFNSNNIHNMQIYRNDTSIKDIEELLCLTCSKNYRYCNQSNCENPHFENSDQDSYKFVGEIASYPFTNINRLLSWVKEYYPNHTNKYCGIHIHLKPTDNDTLILMTKKFNTVLQKSLLQFGMSRGIKKESEFFKRLSGKNKYCLKGYCPTSQYNNRSERYRIINFTSLQKHNTIEIRVLPAFQNYMFALDSIRFVYDFVNTYLLLNTHKQKLNLKPRKLEDMII